MYDNDESKAVCTHTHLKIRVQVQTEPLTVQIDVFIQHDKQEVIEPLPSDNEHKCLVQYLVS